MAWRQLKRFIKREAAHPEPTGDPDQIKLMQSYRDALSGLAGEDVLDDLMEFCCVTSTTFDSDALVSAALQGRREVGLHILHMVFGQMPEPIKNDGMVDYEPFSTGGMN